MGAGDTEQPPDWDWVTSKTLTPCPRHYRGQGPGGGQEQPLAGAQVGEQAGRCGVPSRDQALTTPQDSQVLGFRMLLVMGGPGGADMEKSERQSSSWEQPAWMARR